MERALPEMRGGRQLSFAFLPEGEDPDSYVRSEGAAAFNKVLDSATPMSEFLMQTLSAQCDLATAEGRARIAELARPLIGSTPIGVYRDLLVNRLADEVQLPRERLGQLLETSQRRRASVRRPAAPGTLRNDPWGNLAESLAGLLLNFPELAMDADPLPELQYLKDPRVGLLAELFETARSTPGISPVKLVERYRERPEHGLLSRLLARETELTPEQAKREFEEGVARLRRENSIREMAARTPS